jgi:cytochrome d ubiquinol oxidase subunit II
MFDISSIINLPLFFAAVLALAILLYALLDGFDLGVGILFPFAPTAQCRSKMMNSVAPFWDGNETWLVMGGGGLFAAFPLAYSLIMPTFYIPIILMLFGLIFRGVAFEFHSKTKSIKEQKIWDYSFHFGSLIAAFFQGVILGSFVQGVEVGNVWGWLNSFSLVSGLGVIAGYALLGSTWLIMKTRGRTKIWARQAALYILIFVTFFIGLISLWTPFLNKQILSKWFFDPGILYLAPIPVLTIATLIMLARGVINKKEYQPFLLTIFLFILCYAGLLVTFFPYVIPYSLTFEKAAAASTSLSFLFVGVVIILPIILCYTAFSYWVFRGKASHEKLY